MHIHKWDYLAPVGPAFTSPTRKNALERICIKCKAHHYRIRQFGEFCGWIEHPSWRMHVQPPTVHTNPPLPPGEQTDEFHGEKKQVILL